MERNEILAAGRADFAIGRKGALRSIIWFGFGYHESLIDGDKAGTEFLADVRAVVLAEGAVKSEASARVKQAKVIGTRFRALFGAELASEWPSVAHMVQACFNAAQASGATTVQRLIDWAEHGDAAFADKQAAAKDAERQAAKDAKAAEAAERVASTVGAALAMGFDDVVQPLPPVQNLNPADPADPFAGMDDAALAALIAAATAEMDRRIAAAAKAAA